MPRLTLKTLGLGLSLSLSALIFFAPLCATWAEPSADEEAFEIGQHHLRAALKLIEAKRLRASIPELDRSHRAYPSSEVLHLLARVYDKLPEECERSLSSWRELIQRCAEGCELKRDALASLKQAELDCSGELELTSSPKGVELFLDDRSVGRTPLKLSVSGGSRRLYFYKDGYEPQRFQLSLKRGWDRRVLNVQLKSLVGTRGEARASAEGAPQARSSAPVQLQPSPTRAQERRAQVKSTEQPIATQPAPPPAVEDFFGEQRPYLRLNKSAPLRRGRVAYAGEIGLIAELRCEYLNRFKRYLPLERCEGSRLKLFDRYYLAVQPLQDLYVYVIMSNDYGQWQLIYPVPGEDTHLQAGELRSIPEKEWVLFDQQEGISDRVSILASSTPISSLELSRGALNQEALPVELMRYLIPMSEPFEGESKQIREALIQAQAGAQVLHITFEVLR